MNSNIGDHSNMYMGGVNALLNQWGKTNSLGPSSNSWGSQRADSLVSKKKVVKTSWSSHSCCAWPQATFVYWGEITWQRQL